MDMDMDIDNVRESYAGAELNKNDVPDDPFRLFGKWMKEALASDIKERNGMSLATSTADGLPSVRIVLLKGFNKEEGFIFYTNYNSRKGLELTQNPNAALGFWWPDLEKQIRITGHVYALISDKSETYFNSRPEGSRRGAIISPQSQIIPNRNYLKDQLNDIKKSDLLKRPTHWGGYGLMPSGFEFWQGQADRLHDRISYVQTSDGWDINRLAP